MKPPLHIHLVIRRCGLFGKNVINKDKLLFLFFFCGKGLKYSKKKTLFLQTAKENGNDGIIIKSTSGSLYIVFEPNQIKSVENDGTWDVNDEDIYS